jgi:hypothetical protein
MYCSTNKISGRYDRTASAPWILQGAYGLEGSNMAPWILGAGLTQRVGPSSGAQALKLDRLQATSYKIL